MTGLDIEAIRAEYSMLAGHLANLECCVAHDVAARVPHLLAALVEEQTVHAKTLDNFEAMAESSLEQRTRQLDRYARLDAEHDRLKKAHDDLKQFCAALTEARDEARENYADVCDQLRDERAEVRKLREWNSEIKAERDQLALTHLDVEALRRQLEEALTERDEARAALADALQVIADLRGVS